MSAGAPIRSGTPEFRRLSLSLVIAGFATFSLVYSVQSLLPVFATEFGVSAGEASLVVSFTTGAMAVTLLIASVISDNIGRRQTMTISLFAASVLTLVSAMLPGWHTLLLTRFLIGIAIAGIPAVAMAYVAEEVHPSAIGATMGLYIGGAAIGGMAGRLVASVLSDVMSWRVAVAGIGASSLLGAGIFWWAAPHSRAFVSTKHDWPSFLASLKILSKDAALPWLYAEGFLLMGAFVTLYNYVSFRLLAPPYGLSQSMVGAIFLFYIVGSFSSSWFGTLAGRLGRRKVFWIPMLVFLAGIVATAAAPLSVIIAGIGIATVGYFGAHSVASSWVSRRGGKARAQAAALYLIFLYVGSSIMGSLGGIAWSRAGWPGIAWFTGSMIALALLIAVRLVAVKPLPENAVVEPVPSNQVEA